MLATVLFYYCYSYLNSTSTTTNGSLVINTNTFSPSSNIHILFTFVLVTVVLFYSFVLCFDFLNILYIFLLSFPLLILSSYLFSFLLHVRPSMIQY